MSSVNGTSGNSYANPYSSASSKAAEEEEEEKAKEAADSENTEKTEESAATAEETETLNTYKQKFLAKVKALMSSPHLANVNLDLGITDAGYKKMMEDATYEAAVLDKLKSKTAHSYSALSGTVTVTADGKEDPAALFTENQTIAQRLFSKSSRSLLRTTNLDALTALAQGTITALETSKGRFDTAALLGSNQMRTNNSYIDAYLKNLGIDTTG